MSYEIGRSIRALDGPVLITGHTGFKGTWLTILLESLGIPVVGFSLAPNNDDLYLRANRLGAIPETIGDIRDVTKLMSFIKKHKPSLIFHMAAQPLVLDSYIDPTGTFATNVMGTANLLEASFAQPSVKLVCIITTDKVYKNNNLGFKFKETDPLEGKDPYSASKVGSESVAAAWRQIAHIKGGPLINIYRAGNVIGGGDFAKNRLIPDLIRGVLSGNEVEIRNPKSSRPWQHVLDPLIGYISAANHSILKSESVTLNFGPSENSLTVQEVLTIAEKTWNSVKYKIVRENENYLEATNLGLDSSAAETMLNWKPQINQEQAIVSTMNWWKDILVNKVEITTRLMQDIVQFQSTYQTH